MFATKLACVSVSYSFPEKIILQDLSFSLGAGACLGVIGENGAGKTTLLELLAGIKHPTKGIIETNKHLVYLPQNNKTLDLANTVGQQISLTLQALQQIENELVLAATQLVKQTKHAAQKYELALQKAEIHAVWDATARVEKYLHGLGLQQLKRDKQIGQLSAGQQRRLALALAMVTKVTVLLLDEPTNYLDDTARKFLQKELQNWDGIVVFASHDRYFLDSIPTSICDLGRSYGSKYVYGGAYKDYVEQKRVERLNWVQDYKQQQAELVRLETVAKTVARNINPHRVMTDNNKKAYGARGSRVEAQVSRRVKAVEEKLGRIKTELIPKPPKVLQLAVVEQKPLHNNVLLAQLRKIKVEDRLDVEVTLDVEHDTKLLVSGCNGSGKTTLLEIFAQKVVPTSGVAQFGKQVSVSLLGHVDRFVSEQLSGEQIFAQQVGGLGQNISSLGILDCIDRPAKSLSVGQRKRLELAIVLVLEPDLLLLDEPTNHLSLELCEELFVLLANWKKAVVVATHDPWVQGLPGWQKLEVGS